MWMVRGDGGSLYEAFRERCAAAMGWSELAAHARPGVRREQLITPCESMEPHTKPGTLISGASQDWRFVNEVQVDCP